MRGRWWGLAVILAATTLAVSAKPTSTSSSPSGSVTIPLILRQAAPPKKAEPPPKKEEAKSPQDILEETTPAATHAPTPVAMQDSSPTVPLLDTPPAPTLDLPTSPELFVPDLNGPLPAPKAKVAEPKPASKAPATVAVASPPPTPKEKPAKAADAQPKPVDLATTRASEVKGTPGKRSATMEPVEDVPNGPLPPKGSMKPQAEPVKPAPVGMQPVEELKPAALSAAPDGKPPAFRCQVRDVMAFQDRTHVRCYNAVQGKVSYFAVDTNQPVASTVVSKALTAMQSGKPLMVVFAPDADLNPANCGPKDCRRLLDIEN